jgi:hypothetical protein
VGLKHAQVLMFLEWAAIKTMVMEKGRVEARSELRGKKWVSIKSLMDTLAITWSHEIISQGHIKGRANTLLSSTSEFGRSGVGRVGVTHDR